MFATKQTRIRIDQPRSATVRWHLVLRVVVAVGALYVVVGLVVLALARHEISSGLQKMHSAEAGIQLIGLKQSPSSSMLRGIQAQVASAHDDFDHAAVQLRPFAPVLRRLFWIPRVGGQISAAPEATQLADDATAGASLVLAGLTPTLDLLGHKHRAGITVVLGSLRTSRSVFDESVARLVQAQHDRASLSPGAAKVLSAQLPALDRELPRLLTLSRTLSTVPSIAGFGASRSYLLVYQNPHELRATGGFIGSVAIVNMRDGHVSNQFTSTLLHDNLSYPPPEPLSIYSDEPGWLLRDSNWSPDFPTSAALERFFLKLDLHRDVDGVINLTPQAAGYILQGTGPLYVPEYHQWIDSQNVAALADYYSHWTNGWGGPHTYANWDTGRKQFMPIVGHHILESLGTLSLRRWVRLGQALSNAIATRDILLNLRAPREQSLIHSFGAGGEINPTASDFLYVVDTNIGWSKINQFVHKTTSYVVTIRQDNWLDVRLTLHVTNVPAPSRYRAQQWQGPGLGRLGSWDDYGTFLRIYVPTGSQMISQDGWWQPWSPGPAYGKTMFSGYVIVRSGKSVSVHLHYVVPPNVLMWSHGKRYRLVMQHQPGDYPKRWSVVVRQVGGSSHSWIDLHPTTDWTGTFGIKQRPVHPIPLPAQPPFSVAPGHWIEPHAFLALPHS